MPNAAPGPAPRRPRSSLALLQQALVLGTGAFVVAWVWYWWARSPTVALAGAALSLGAYAVVLGLEGLAALWRNRQDPAPTAGWRGTLGAWWQEVRLAPKVFAWRQPFRWRELPDDAVPVDGRGAAVVFVHGFICNRGFWLPWMERLRSERRPYVSVNLEPVFGEIDEYVPLLSEAVQRAHALTGLPPVLVCHSMGGLVARAWREAEPQTPVQTIITIGSPHRGTWLGNFSRMPNGRQMRPDCDWLCELLARESRRMPQDAYADFVCWYSNADNIVFPTSTATLPGADNRLVPGMAHVALAFHPRVMDESLAIVASGGRSPSERTAA